MRLVLLAAVVGAALGVARRGRPLHGADRRVRLWPLLVGGLAAQLAVAMLDGGGLGVLLMSYALLVAFALANLWTVGMWLVGLGVALNLVVIAANQGMPVRAEALVHAGVAGPQEVTALEFTAKRHLEDPHDRLTALADIVAVPALGEVISFGDLFMSTGVAVVLAHLLRRRRSTDGP
ncbi:MAG: DUF5317 family protein [Acidimicrobiales bacterium]